MSTSRYPPEMLRKVVGSPRPKIRENSKDTLCRNVTIYGHCRYEDQGCAFNHDTSKTYGAAAHTEKKIEDEIEEKIRGYERAFARLEESRY